MGSIQAHIYKHDGVTMTLLGVPIVVDLNAPMTYGTYDFTAFGSDYHWCFAPMNHLAFGQME